MYYKVLQTVTLILLSVISYYIVPEIKRNLQKSTKNSDGTINKDALFWTNLAIKVIEEIKGSGNGSIKKDAVINYVRKLNIPVTDQELSSLIDLIVGYYNTSGWEKDILDALRGE